ncbi:MAG: cytochrome c, partial [Pseudolabrys sp.]
MSKSAEIALGAALVAAFATSTMAQSKKESPRNYGIGHVATAEQMDGWDIDVRPDGQGAPAG